jgi:hypothetical protein
MPIALPFNSHASPTVLTLLGNVVGSFVRKHLVFKICVVLAYDRLCGLVVRVLGYRSGGPGSIPDTTRKKK